MSENFSKTFVVILVFLFSISLSAQTKTRKSNSKKSSKEPVAIKPAVTAESQTSSVEEPTVRTPSKKNERPTNENTGSPNPSKNENQPIYFYEFSQPDFVVKKITIEHDESGNGKIYFLKKDWNEQDSEPLRISDTALERIKAAFEALNFLDSTENYQYEKDYSHLGNIVIKLRKNGREREVKFNWTENKEARALATEYRRLSNQALWIFDVNVARVNQPLETPKLMDLLDNYLRRNELSDPKQLIPFLQELSNDERIPLIARNRAAKIMANIEKTKENGK